ncbi:uncharacterized protein [Dysidea avara]|uniref:uncharacterized protein isoform X5 n=1 Tax=Dysidea avara TaxID=196820 RepID=UPI00332F42A9
MELNSESPPFTSFADLCILQSYPVVLLPSMFIIGHHGIPMNIIYGSKNITTSELAMKTTRSIELRRSGETSPLARRITSYAKLFPWARNLTHISPAYRAVYNGDLVSTGPTQI